jgi:hypothetical protein
MDRRKANVPSTKPYTVNIVAGGYVPQEANITIMSNGSYLWIPDIPLGIGPHVMTMTDAKGYTGGVGHTLLTAASSPNERTRIGIRALPNGGQ